jgi:hypothetical protein
MRQEVEALEVDWVGVSGQRRVYHLKGRAKAQPAKTLLKVKHSQKWLDLPDVGYHLLWLGAAECALGAVVLVVAEHLASGHRELYVLPPQTEEEALERVTRVLVRDLETADESRLDLMVDLVDQSVQAGIQAETGVFDRGYFSIRFILQVLKVGLKRVILPAKKGVHYRVADTIYDLPDLWPLLTDSDFQAVANEHRTYQIASLQATLGDLGLVQLVFVRQLARHHKILRSFVLVCTDVQFAPAAVLQAYLLRWRIEVGYREVKQNHAFGRTLSADLEEVYGQLVLSFLAYTCLSVTRLLTARLHDKTLGWIKREYFNARVEFQIAADGALTILFPPWLLDSLGLPDYCMLC